MTKTYHSGIRTTTSSTIVYSTDMTRGTATYFNNKKGVKRSSIVWSVHLDKNMNITLSKAQSQELIDFDSMPYYSVESNELRFDLQCGR